MKFMKMVEKILLGFFGTLIIPATSFSLAQDCLHVVQREENYQNGHLLEFSQREEGGRKMCVIVIAVPPFKTKEKMRRVEVVRFID